MILEIPGGTTDAEDTSLEEAVRRELREETGYGGGSFVEVGRVCPNPATQNNVTYCFLASGVERVADPHPHETDHMEVVLMPLDEAVRRAQNSEFLQALHVSALFFALARMGRVQ